MIPDPKVIALVRMCRLRADCAAVWAAISNPDQLAAWFPDRVEGGFALGDSGCWVFERFGLRVPYTVIARDEGRSIQWNFTTPENQGQVAFHLRADPEGSVLELVDNSTHADPEERASSESGWIMVMASLDYWLTTAPGMKRESWFALRFTNFEREAVPEMYRTATGLARWLTREGSLGAEGTAYRLVLRDGTVMTGTVLAHSTHETLLSWDEQRALLTLKAFNYGPAGPALAIHGFGYGMDPETAADHEARFGAALERLIHCFS